MKNLNYFIVATSFLLGSLPLSQAADIQIKVFGYGPPRSTDHVYPGDGIQFIPAIVIGTGEEEVGDPPASKEYIRYLATIPDVWFTENRGMAFHVPGLGTTAYLPIASYGGAYALDVDDTNFPTYHSPSENPQAVGNQLLLGNWWNATTAVATLNTWDNENEFWPAVGIDFIASTGHVFWRWMHPNEGGAAHDSAMELDYKHRLTLFKRGSGSQKIVLDPELGQITIEGTPVLTSISAGGQFVGKTATGVNLALSGGTLRAAQAGKPLQVLLGARNDDRITDADGTDHTQGVLIVGSTAAPGTNGLRILDDGTVLIMPKGGLQMATEFSKGPRP